MMTPCDSRRPVLNLVLQASVCLAVPAMLFVNSAAGREQPDAEKPNDVEKPNIVFIMADDMGYGDPGCYNPDSKVPTPHMDRLATEGMRFTDAHSPSAVCTPTRYGVLTGRYAWRTRLKDGVLWGYSRSLIEPGRMTVASLLKEHGYVTGCVGKWHLGFQEYQEGQDEDVDYSRPLRPGPTTVGFDDFYGIPASLDMEPYVYVENDRPVEQPTEQTEGSQHRRRGGGGFWRAGPIAPGFQHLDVLPVTTRKAVEFIEQQAEEADSRPFFLYFPLSAPHTPWLPTDDFRGRSGAGYYGDFTVQVDWSIGQVIDALDRLDFKENTLLIVTSDNGAHWLPDDIEQFEHRANLHWRGQKADIWEGGHRVPFLARWPGKIEAGSTSNETIGLTDLLATCAAVVGETLPDDAGEDSENILPILLGQERDRPIREAIVHHSARGFFAIRQGDWKLITSRGSGGFSPPRQIDPEPDEPTGQLYNLADDPAETVNLYQGRPEIVERLTALLEKYKTQGHSRAATSKGEEE